MKNRIQFLFATITILFLGLVSIESHALVGKLPDFTELVVENSPAVVNISTVQKQRRIGSFKIPDKFNIPDMPEGIPFEDMLKKYFGHPDIGEQPDSEAQSLGSGFIIDEDGYILTNNHVIEDAEEIIVRLSDRRELQATVVGTDKQSDIALLKIEADHLPVVKLGHSGDLKVGEWVMAIGSPFGFDHSVSVGIVSALGRSLPSENYVPYIQTDVAINPGNSGGPLFNLDGEVVGINSQIYSRTGGYMGLSFAIPVSVALDVVKQLKERGHVTRGWLGVLIQDVTRELAESFGMDRPEGALIAQIIDDSPAAEAGIEVGDVIIEYSGKPIIKSPDLPPLVGLTEIGKETELKVLRNGKIKSLKITIGKLPEEGQMAKGAGKKQKAGDIELVGLAVRELTADERKERDIKKGGVFVKEVTAGAARKAGVSEGDLVIKLNNVHIEGVSHFRTVIEGIKPNRSVPMLVMRGDNPRFLALKITE
ncbi:MAG: Do family serine endopeptidase [Gammaproteobacteria bacterium]|nr:Do family serine endopeptidase [Gammaproteobacteria bacterium]